MGVNYVLQQPYDMAQTYVETSPAIPMFFVLFPGVDPTPWVESLARTLDITTENGEPAFRHDMVCFSRLTCTFISISEFSCVYRIDCARRTSNSLGILRSIWFVLKSSASICVSNVAFDRKRLLNSAPFAATLRLNRQLMSVLQENSSTYLWDKARRSRPRELLRGETRYYSNPYIFDQEECWASI